MFNVYVRVAIRTQQSALVVAQLSLSRLSQVICDDSTGEPTRKSQHFVDWLCCVSNAIRKWKYKTFPSFGFSSEENLKKPRISLSQHTIHSNKSKSYLSLHSHTHAEVEMRISYVFPSLCWISFSFSVPLSRPKDLNMCNYIFIFSFSIFSSSLALSPVSRKGFSYSFLSATKITHSLPFSHIRGWATIDWGWRFLFFCHFDSIESSHCLLRE